MRATFYYDFQSPYAYLAAHRVDDAMPCEVVWQPIAFGPLLARIGKVPWSFREGPARDAEMRGCEARAAARGLPLRWPPGWPRATYSILALRAALVAQEADRLRELSHQLYRHGLGLGRDLTQPDVVLQAAVDAGLDAALVRDGVRRPEVKQRLREVTDAAIARGVTGIPTVAVGEELFWGEDRLEDAAAAAAGSNGPAGRY